MTVEPHPESAPEPLAMPDSASHQGVEVGPLEAFVAPSHGLVVERAWRGLFAPATLIVIAQGMLAFVLYRTDGHRNWMATFWILVMLALLARALLGLNRGVVAGVESAVRILWGLVISEGLGALDVRFSRPGNDVQGGLWPFVLLESCALLLIGTYGFDLLLGWAPRPSVAALRRAALASVAMSIGVWMLRASPNPRIDLFPVQNQAAEALLAGRSIYEPGAIRTKETFSNKDEINEYTYFPLPACLTTVAYVVGHDVRWAALVSQLLGALLLGWIARRSSAASAPSPARRAWGELLAWALLFHPRGPFVLEQAWTEPLALPLLGGVVALVLVKRGGLASVSLGLLCAMKQHLFLYAPFLALLPGVGWLGLVIASAVGLVTIAPFAIPNPPGFYRGVFSTLVNNPFRPDALSIPADLAALGYTLPTWVGFVTGLIPLGWLRWLRREPSPVLLASSLAFGLFYVFGRQAFCNYYYLLNSTILFAAAALAQAPTEPRQTA